MIRSLFTVFLLLTLIKTNAQFVLDLVPKNNSEKCVDFYLAEVVDDRRSEEAALGSIYKPNLQKTKVVFQEGPEKSIGDYIRKSFRQDTKGVPVQVRIDECSITENLRGSREIKGEMKLVITVFSIKQEKLIKICEARSNTTYERSPENEIESQLSAEMSKLVNSAFVFVIRNIDKNKGVIEAFVKESYVEILPFYQAEDADTLYYQSRKVTWDDFKAAPRAGSQYGAAIFTNFAIDTKITIKDRVLTAYVRPKVLMDKNMSWARTAAKTIDGLRHEQLHFDITYLVMMEFLNKIKDFKADTVDDLGSMIHFEYLEYYRKMNKVQERYDSETRHSLYLNQQILWENKINEQLKTTRL